MADRTLLDQAVEKYHIPSWPYEAAYDRVIVFSLPEDKATRETYIRGGIITKPQTARDYDMSTTPRAVIVSAGLGARDVLRSHFMDLGHIVWVARLSPWRHQVDTSKDGKPIEFMFIRVGDIVGSETLQDYIKSGRVQVRVDKDGIHCFANDDGGCIPRFDPPSYVA